MNLKLLAIDDDPLILEIIAGNLSSHAFKVTTASDGLQGLELFQHHAFDIVLTDLYMPKLNGLEVLETITASAPDTPVIVVSGAGGLQDSIEALRLGAWDYVLKPIDFPLLIHQINKALERANLLLENKKYRDNLEQEIRKRTAQLDQNTRELEEANLVLTEEIEARKTIQRELQQAASQWQTTFNSMTEFISVHAPDFTITQANQAMLDFLDLPSEKIIGSKCCKLMHAPGESLENCPLSKTLATGMAHSWEITHAKTGIPLLITTSPIYEEGQVIGIVHVAKDISEQKRLEAERQKSINLEAIAGLAGGIAHDFNNLLTALSGYIDLARMDKLPPKALEYLDNAKMVTQLTSELTQQLLTFSQGGRPLKQAISLRNILESSLRKIPFDDKKVNTVISSPADLWEVMADQRQLRIVLTNIFYNSLESMVNGGTLRVYTENIRGGSGDFSPLGVDCVLVCIEDNGSGISKANLNKIFDPYFTTKEKGADKGKGLGLAICYSIIKKHNGRISITSEKGKGTTVSLYLPASTTA